MKHGTLENVTVKEMSDYLKKHAYDSRYKIEMPKVGQVLMLYEPELERMVVAKVIRVHDKFYDAQICCQSGEHFVESFWGKVTNYIADTDYSKMKGAN